MNLVLLLLDVFLVFLVLLLLLCSGVKILPSVNKFGEAIIFELVFRFVAGHLLKKIQIDACASSFKLAQSLTEVHLHVLHVETASTKGGSMEWPRVRWVFMPPRLVKVITVDLVAVPACAVRVVNFSLVNCPAFVVLPACVSLTLVPVLLPLVLLDSPGHSVAVLTRYFEVMVCDKLVVPHFADTVNKLKVHFFVWLSWIMFLYIASSCLQD